ncbi:hypothetical protein NC651_036774 [Populus alba x Populus x berolinensis]|nr:hypothetical protein NC651_036774 [Populus alba x Populus x berolinensis]
MKSFDVIYKRCNKLEMRIPLLIWFSTEALPSLKLLVWQGAFKEPPLIEQRLGTVSKKSVDSRFKSAVVKDGPSAHFSATFTYEELSFATNNFRSESLIGRGGFGAVFKGKLESTGQVVAVKQLDPSGIQGDKEFLVEVLMLSLLHHPNLVNLIGFCAEGDHRLLVYEYMPLGSLEDRLFDVTPHMEPLDWNTRMKIAAGAAGGLDSLHSANPPVIYRDLKASNILLEDGFNPKLSDFGLAKFGPVGDKSYVSTRVMGTYGYCAPEYASSGRLTIKTDIYSYGIVLLELITGHRALDEVNGHQEYLVNWALPLMKDHNFSRLADPMLKGKYSMSVLKKVIEVASMCLGENANSRPSSSELVQAMDYLFSRKNESKKVKNDCAKWPEIDFSPSHSKMILDKDLDRDLAVAEAKVWGVKWRERREQIQRSISDEDNR